MYYTAASHFLLQIKDLRTRRAICIQIFLYLYHLRNTLTKQQELADIELLTKMVASLIRKTAGGDVLMDCLSRHMGREQMWNEWKAKKLTVLVEEHPHESHVVQEVGVGMRAASDVRVLCRPNTLKAFVGGGVGDHGVARVVARDLHGYFALHE